ncbi:MAG: chromosome segregation protein SMC [Rhodobacteraceae bacterium]|nr:chromosome segregation protein SMC [Paracoccaceae bacterium]
MKIRAITLTNVRRFTDPVRVDGIGDGLNVLCEPNEHGKSTLFDAIQALFFKAHGSKDKDISALRPHAGGAPEVAVDVETEAGRFTITKRWWQKPMATVHQQGRLVAQADAAEAWIADMLGGDAAGPSGLVWVRQGMTELGGGSKKEQDLALAARRDLMSSVGEEVEALTGGRRMDRALQRCHAELDAYATGKNRTPRKGGPWKTALDRVAELNDQRDTLAATAADLHDALAARQRARRDLKDWTAPDAVADRRQRLEAVQAAHATAERHAQEVETAARRLDLARLSAEQAGSRLANFRAAEQERTEATALVAQAETAALAARALLDDRRANADSAAITLQNAEAALAKAETLRRRADRSRAAREGADRRRDLAERIRRAEAARAEMETAAAAARTGPDARTMQKIETLASAHAAAQAARDAAAPQIVAHYAPGQDGAIRLDDTPLPDGTARPLTRSARLVIDGIGTLDIRPGDQGQDDTAVGRAEAALKEALSAIGADEIETARTAAADRASAERAHGEARAVFGSLAPEGLAPLHDALAAIPVTPGSTDTPEEDAPDPEAAEAALDAARAATETARQASTAAQAALADARSEATRADTELASVRDRLARASAMLRDRPEDTGAALAQAARQADAALAAARDDHDTTQRNAPDLASAKAALARAQSIEDRAASEIARLTPLLATLDERISRSAGDAVEERLAETEEALQAAEADLARIEHDVAVLTRLSQALEAARTEARERYFAPIARELRPLLQLLWPDAELTWGQESLLPDALVRDGRTEPIDVLSGGTQEQVALLVRLAFARMLAGSGRHAPVILDDALVFTDDDRIERMFDALHRQAGELQIIVLTCRQRAFRDLGGHGLTLAPVAP